MVRVNLKKGIRPYIFFMKRVSLWYMSSWMWNDKQDMGWCMMIIIVCNVELLLYSLLPNMLGVLGICTKISALFVTGAVVQGRHPRLEKKRGRHTHDLLWPSLDWPIQSQTQIASNSPRQFFPAPAVKTSNLESPSTIDRDLQRSPLTSLSSPCFFPVLLLPLL